MVSLTTPAPNKDIAKRGPGTYGEGGSFTNPDTGPHILSPQALPLRLIAIERESFLVLP